MQTVAKLEIPFFAESERPRYVLTRFVENQCSDSSDFSIIFLSAMSLAFHSRRTKMTSAKMMHFSLHEVVALAAM